MDNFFTFSYILFFTLKDPKYAILFLSTIVIITAPLWTIFNKSGIKPWAAAIPGFNIINTIKKSGLHLLTIIPTVLSLLFILIPTWFIIYKSGFVTIEYVFLQQLLSLLIAIIFIAVITPLHFFPMLSTIMLILFYNVYTQTFLPGAWGIRFKLFLPIFCVILVAQILFEIITWINILKRFKRPKWNIIFPILPVSCFVVLLLVSLFGFIFGIYQNLLVAFNSIIIPSLIAGTIGLIIGLFFIYYIAYSVKIKYQA